MIISIFLSFCFLISGKIPELWTLCLWLRHWHWLKGMYKASFPIIVQGLYRKRHLSYWVHIFQSTWSCRGNKRTLPIQKKKKVLPEARIKKVSRTKNMGREFLRSTTLLCLELFRWTTKPVITMKKIWFLFLWITNIRTNISCSKHPFSVPKCVTHTLRSS